MAEGKADVVFYLDKILVKVEEAAKQSLEAIAHQIEGQAKANVVANDQVDTGFMNNAIYVVTPDHNSYNNTWSSGRYAQNPQKHGGQSGRPKRKLSPMVDVKQNQAAVVAGAEYAIFQETKKSFLFRAAEQVGPQVGGIVEKVGRKVLVD